MAKACVTCLTLGTTNHFHTLVLLLHCSAFAPGSNRTRSKNGFLFPCSWAVPVRPEYWRPDETLSTTIVKCGGKNPQFDQNLQIKITQPDAVMKCEMWMLSRAKNYLEDQLLGFALVPLSSVVGKGKFTQDFALSSTDLFHSPAGTVRLTLQYRGLSSSDCHGNSFASTNLALSPASISSEVVLLDRSSEELRPVDYGSIEFPDMEIARQNEQLVSEYFKMASNEIKMENESKSEFQVADQTGFSGVTFLHLGATPIADDDYDMSLNAEEEKHADPHSSTQETNLFAYRNPTDGENSSHTGIVSSTTTSLSEEHSFLDFGEQKSSSVGESSHSHGSSPATIPTFESSAETPTSAHGNVSGDNQRALSSEEDTDKEGTGSSSETRMTERNSEPIFTKPLISINLEPDQTVVQQQIVDMYMKSMQQFTESLAKMKLPMDIETNESDDNTDTTSKQKKIETGKKEGARVYYGSRAFF
ncbi:hypothetical protein SUGI_0825830 [Cryptomeria japonica]|nr:hypothetical protein SUGI_0825830 [Cryptomeria japonica]